MSCFGKWLFHVPNSATLRCRRSTYAFVLAQFLGTKVMAIFILYTFTWGSGLGSKMVHPVAILNASNLRKDSELAENLFYHKQLNPGLMSTLRWLCSSKFMSICLSERCKCFLPANDRRSIWTTSIWWQCRPSGLWHKVLDVQST